MVPLVPPYCACAAPGGFVHVAAPVHAPALRVHGAGTGTGVTPAGPTLAELPGARVGRPGRNGGADCRSPRSSGPSGPRHRRAAVALARWRPEPLSAPVQVAQRYGDGGLRLVGPVLTTVEPDARSHCRTPAVVRAPAHPHMTRSTIRPLPGSRPRTGDRQRGPGRRADSEGWRGRGYMPGRTAHIGREYLHAGEVP